MTTNYPEKLDSALIRPGRVDLQKGFTLATRSRIHSIFTCMYSTEHDVRPNVEAAVAYPANSPSTAAQNTSAHNPNTGA